MKSIRLDKFLADSQLGTRSEVRQLLKKGLVSVNGEMVKKPDFKIDPASDRVCFDGKEVSSQQKVYYMLNKPAGVVSATRDNHDRTVLDLLPPGDRRPDLFPVGRLDKDTTGLLLITNDGALSHRLLSPRRHVDKTYFVRVNGRIREETVEAFRKGIDIGDEKITLPAELKPLGEDQALVTIREGRFHQIKRMFHAGGCEVTGLKRLTMGSLVLDENLPEGSFRRLTEEELSRLRQD